MIRYAASFVLGRVLSLALGLALFSAGQVQGAAKAQVPQTAGAIALAALPIEGQRVYALILHGGPFRYAKDGDIFGNRERILPAQKRGYYREYTVRSNFSAGRGAQRIVCGGARPTEPDACYYTTNHYASFRRIEP